MDQEDKFAAKQGNAFGTAIDDATVIKIIAVIDDQINYEKTIADMDSDIRKEHIKGINDSKLTKAEKEEALKNPMPKIEFKDNYEKFNFGFNKLLERGKTILHDVDGDGNINIKVYDVAEEYNYRVVGTYKVEVTETPKK